MYAGQIVEDATLEDLFYDPQHPYTWGLLGSLARLDQPRPVRLAQIAGSPPSLLNPPTGCRFAPRCPHEFDKCARAATAATVTAAGSTRPTSAAARRRRPDRPAEGRWRHDRRTPARGHRPGQALPDQVGRRRRPRGRPREGRRRRQPHHQRGRNPRPGRRIRLRQVDSEPDHPAADRADVGIGPVPRRGAGGPVAAQPAPGPATDADDLPGSRTRR